ncbi:MAG: hypothetical protein VCC20_07330, partial [Myxococcota bacterium]
EEEPDAGGVEQAASGDDTGLPEDGSVASTAGGEGSSPDLAHIPKQPSKTSDESESDESESDERTPQQREALRILADWVLLNS